MKNFRKVLLPFVFAVTLALFSFKSSEGYSETIVDSQCVPRPLAQSNCSATNTGPVCTSIAPGNPVAWKLGSGCLTLLYQP